jgi:hypothetical protein
MPVPHPLEPAFGNRPEGSPFGWLAQFGRGRRAQVQRVHIRQSEVAPLPGDLLYRRAGSVPRTTKTSIIGETAVPGGKDNAMTDIINSVGDVADGIYGKGKEIVRVVTYAMRCWRKDSLRPCCGVSSIPSRC